MFYTFMGLLFKLGYLHQIEKISLGFLAFFYLYIAATAWTDQITIPSVQTPHLLSIPFSHLFIFVAYGCGGGRCFMG